MKLALWFLLTLVCSLSLADNVEGEDPKTSRPLKSNIVGEEFHREYERRTEHGVVLTEELRRLGILPGDVLLQFNDVKLDNPAKGVEAFQTVRTDKVVKLRILRKKKNVVLTYERQD